MKICIEYDTLYDAAEACGCEDDFSQEAWEYLEQLLDDTHSSDEVFTGVESLKWDFTESEIESWASDCLLDVPEGVDLQDIGADALSDFLRDNDAGECALDTSDGLTVLIHLVHGAPDDDAWHDFLIEQGLVEEEEEEEEEEEA